MGNISALGFMLLSFALPLTSSLVRSNRTLLFAIWLSLGFRHGLALINAFLTPLSSAWGDLYNFHNKAAGLMVNDNQPYASLLGVVYKIFGVSFWLGEVCSVVAFVVSTLVMLDIIRLIGGERWMPAAVLVFGLMPSPAIHCSVTLRESYQVLGFLGVAHALLSMRDGRLGPRTFFQLLVSLILLISMHQGLAPFALGVLVLGLPWAMQKKGAVSAAAGFCFFLVVPILLPVAVDRLQEKSSALRAINEGNFLAYAARYRNYIQIARSDYGVKIDGSDVVSFAQTGAAVVAMYFIAPLPWQVSSSIDYYAFFENVVRLALILVALHRISASPYEQGQRIFFLLCLAVALEGLWALGTTNWGTALRHHVVSLSLFASVGAPALSSLFFSPEMVSLNLRRERRRARLTHGF